MAGIEIKMLGTFEILVDGHAVLTQLTQSRKATALVQYLVLQRGERVPHKTLTDTLWGGERCANPDMALRAILHRFRSMIAQEHLTVLENCIVTNRGSYQWNTELPCRVDVFEMEDLAMASGQEKDPARRVELEERIVALYRGRLLPLSANEPWVESHAVRLHVFYRAAMIHLLEQYKKTGENERIVALCANALEKNPHAERIYLEQIMALEALGRQEEARQVMQRGLAVGCLHQAAEPGRVGAMWRQARQADRNMESEMKRLVAALPSETAAGAMICSFETFGQIYRMQRSVQAQYNVPVFLLLVTMVPVQPQDPEETEHMMEVLENLLHTCLRSFDVAARYSDTQYAVQLCGMPGQSAELLERIKQAFYRTPAKGRYLLNYNAFSPKPGQAAPRRRRTRTVKRV